MRTAGTASAARRDSATSRRSASGATLRAGARRRAARPRTSGRPSSIPGQRAGELDPPRQRPPPGDVGRRNTTEQVREPVYAAGRPFHSEESTTSLSTTSASSPSSLLSQSGRPRHRQNAGRSEMRSGRTIDAGCRAASPLILISITSDSTSRPPSIPKLRTLASASISFLRPGSGTRKIVRAGWRSSRPTRTRFALASHGCGAQTMWVIVLVRRSGTSSASWRHRCLASLRSISATTPISASATSGRRGGGARRPPTAPSSRPRSSGTTDGRAPRRRPSRRRASTAPRPRPHG